MSFILKIIQPDRTDLAEKQIQTYTSFRRNTATLFALMLLSPIAMSQTPPSSANGWYKSASDSAITAYQNGVLWSPVRKPTTIHRYFSPVIFSTGSRIDVSLNWKSDGDKDNYYRELECSNANPTQQGKGISDSYLRCLAGTGDFRIGFFQSTKMVGNNTCEGNNIKTNCQGSNLPTKEFNDYRGFQFRIQPHLSAGYSATPARLMEDHGNGESESHINLNLWTRIKTGVNGLMSDECQAIDHCGFSKGSGWGTEPVSWGPNMPFGEARPLQVAIKRLSASDFEVVVTMNGNRSPVLRGKFPDNFRPEYFDTMAITYTNSSRRYEYVSLTDFTISGSGTGTPPNPPAEAPKCELGNLAPLVTGALGHYKATQILGSQPLSYRWDFGDGGSVATGAEATRSYSAAGSYGVRLTVSNTLGSSSCSATQIVGEALPPKAFEFAHYRFENSMSDASGFGYHAKIVNHASYSDIAREGKNSLKLEAPEKDYLTLPVALASTEDFSFAAWVRWNGGNSWQNIFSAGRDGDNVMFLTVSDSNKKLRFRIEKNGVKQELFTNVSLATQRYYHIALTLKGNRATLYVDGKAIAQSDTISFNPQQLAATKVWLGRSHFNDPYFDGRLDDVRFYGKALTAEEIQVLAR